MTVSSVSRALEYDTSPNFLRGDRLRYAPESGHTFRKAQSQCGLEGVYVLRESSEGKATNVPVVYVCRANTEEDARAIHRKVWNQNIVPFLIVYTDTNVRLYTGFDYARPTSGPTETGLLKEGSLHDVAQLLAAFNARAIDDGSLWQQWGTAVRPEHRVDWRLLDNLQELGGWLRENGLADRSVAHALIGKYVYLQYLRARGILSNKKLTEWGINERDIFGRSATLRAFREVVDRLEEWLNGAVFPISLSELKEIRSEHLKRVAGAFAGDTLDGQLHLDFEAYDFAQIPIETISVIYEQFLHVSEDGGRTSAGRERGAYYTPMPVVSYILNELSRRRSLRPGMRVLDATCGSGAFLVQCYRHLVEQCFRLNRGALLRPVELRELLVKHIFGMDIDPDACRVAELSLILTLLDYVDPPDLSNTTFKLPKLSDQNISCADAFADAVDDAPLFSRLRQRCYDWVVGNPPWKELRGHSVAPQDEHAWAWMNQHRDRHPTGGNQIAEAFAWRARDFVDSKGVIGLLLPAMTLFKDESRPFRERFFRTNAVWHVANFANLAEVLFAGRSRVPAAAFFYSVVEENAPDSLLPEEVSVYSPLVANQEATRPLRPRARRESWSLVVNASEVRRIPYRDVLAGNMLPWKTASWGSRWDDRLLRKLAESRFPALADWAAENAIVISEGLQLRGESGERGAERVEHHPELVGQWRLNMAGLRKRRHLLTVPREAVERITETEAYIRRRGGVDLPLRICEPPHVIVSAARHFAMFSDEFLVVPPRQIGIAGSPGTTRVLKALALYLNSDFVRYHQFLISPQFGVKRECATLEALRQLPVPIPWDADADLSSWCDTYDALVQFSRAESVAPVPPTELESLLRQANTLVYESLGLGARDRALVHDLVHVRMALSDGKVGHEATMRPTEGEIQDYAEMLKAELDEFIGAERDDHHTVHVWSGGKFGIVQVGIATGATTSRAAEVRQLSEPLNEELRDVLEQLRLRHSQWVYFNRNLTVYHNGSTYIFKPLQRVHWTQSQALIDAGEVIAETITPAGA
ncbi:MAG: N-6 DNA methylase [Planctomycetota bacterium]